VSDCPGCRNLSNPIHQGTREMCQIVQDVGIAQVTLYLVTGQLYVLSLTYDFIGYIKC
jgi:hypothetical protein